MILRWSLAFLMAASVCVGCSSSYSCLYTARSTQNKKYPAQKQPKARVVQLPIKNSSDCAAPWSFSAELTSLLCHAAAESHAVEWKTVNFSRSGSRVKCPADPFGTNLSFARFYRSHADFVVAMELLSHEIAPIDLGERSSIFPAEGYFCSSQLKMKVRLRIIDIRSRCPRLLHQEVVNCNFTIPKEAERIDYFKMRRKSEAFLKTPWGIAHRRMSGVLVAAVERAICTATGE